MNAVASPRSFRDVSIADDRPVERSSSTSRNLDFFYGKNQVAEGGLDPLRDATPSPP